MRSRNPPCPPEVPLRPGPERRRPGTCCRRRSEASAGVRCRKQSRIPLRTMVAVAAAAPPGSPQPHMAAAGRPCAPAPPRHGPSSPGRARGVMLPAAPGAMVQPNAGQCGRGVSPLPASDWLLRYRPRFLLPAAQREPMGVPRRGGRWEDGGRQQRWPGRSVPAPRSAGSLRVARQVPRGVEAARREGAGGGGAVSGGAASGEGLGGGRARAGVPGREGERGPGPSLLRGWCFSLLQQSYEIAVSLCALSVQRAVAAP